MQITTVRPAALAAPFAPSTDERLLIDRMRANETLARIRTLNVAPRVWGSVGYRNAANYVVDSMRAAGWSVRLEQLRNPEGRTVLNVVADRRGSGPDGQRGLVVAGAHLDTVAGAPGANDNASGSATLIELAEAFAGVPTRNDLRFVWFDGEETTGHWGSNAHVKANSADTARTVAMVNMDMVGSQFGRPAFDLGLRTSNAYGDAVRGVMQRTGLGGREQARHKWSDHNSFDLAGIPAIDFGVDINNVRGQDPSYHSPRDTADKINPGVLEGYGDLIATTVLDMAQRTKRI